ncbi:Cell Wall Hydrolase [Methyloligella halotolerans]|uniref:Cell Wall Hydrolase n=1 Tax=Methyloligella halotolerans TaxID=1177755 RepID=A0A1E2RZ29_9HYPH|nr:cell wall hydrolase [Methyloligella halotolerans]ODA67358.1 Cell Wall Hydrolase [Methyloligella halotolerans]
MGRKAIRLCVIGVLGTAGLSLGGCTGNFGSVDGIEVTGQERDCLTRAMYFESQRNSEEGLLAVGTVVMNRVKSDQYPNTICGVVGQRRQFAHGVLRREMDPGQKVAADKVAGEVLAGKRSKEVGEAMYFHAARIRIPYKNVHYVTVAGGNAFYEKRPGGGRQLPPLETPATAVAEAEEAAPQTTTLAGAEAKQSPIPAPVTQTAEAETPKPPVTPVAASMSALPSEMAPSFAEPVEAAPNTTFIQKSTFGW